MRIDDGRKILFNKMCPC